MPNGYWPSRLTSLMPTSAFRGKECRAQKTQRLGDGDAEHRRECRPSQSKDRLTGSSFRRRSRVSYVGDLYRTRCVGEVKGCLAHFWLYGTEFCGLFRKAETPVLSGRFWPVLWYTGPLAS